MQKKKKNWQPWNLLSVAMRQRWGKVLYVHLVCLFLVSPPSVYGPVTVQVMKAARIRSGLAAMATAQQTLAEQQL